MKAISTLIAVILLLLITISVIGLSAVFFSRITSTASQAAQNETSEQLARLSKQVNIDAYNSTSVTIRSTGTGTIAASEIQVYVAGSPRTCSPALTAIAPGSIQTCNFSPPCAGQALRVTAPASSIEVNC